MMEEWKRRRFAHIAYSTQVQYDKVLRLHFETLLPLTIYEITPKRIDAWLDELKANTILSTKRLTRISYGHELSLLSTILKYYQDYYDDSVFQFPIKQRHRDAIRLSRPRTDVPKDLSEIEFLKFRDELRQCKNGPMLACLATVQYYQALRISEAAGLYWEDVHLHLEEPRNSRIKIVRSVCYPHRGGEEAFIKGGFKNSSSNKGVKEQPMFPEVFEAFRMLYQPENAGLVFGVADKPIPYRTIQCHFDRSFKRAGLPYRGNHVMRHGGCRWVFNKGGDLSIAQQLLGNSDLKTTLVYAKRHASALTDVVHGYWDKKKTALLANACNAVSES
jgi:integrase